MAHLIYLRYIIILFEVFHLSQFESFSGFLSFLLTKLILMEPAVICGIKDIAASGVLEISVTDALSFVFLLHSHCTMMRCRESPCKSAHRELRMLASSSTGLSVFIDVKKTNNIFIILLRGKTLCPTITEDSFSLY